MAVTVRHVVRSMGIGGNAPTVVLSMGADVTKGNEMRPPVDKPLFKICFLCEKSFWFGPHAYNGKYIHQWDITVCSECYASNHDGIVIEQHPRLIEHLTAQKITVHLNEKGWLDWPQA